MPHQRKGRAKMVKIWRETIRGELHERAELTTKDRHNAAAAVRWVARRVDAQAGQGASPGAMRAKEKAAYLFDLAKAIQLSADWWSCIDDLLLAHRESEWEADHAEASPDKPPRKRRRRKADGKAK